MKWRLYKKDDPNTWPHIDCAMVLYGGVPFYRNLLDIFKWDNTAKKFVYCDKRVLSVDECYYAYIGYVPSGYKTLYPTKCMCENDDRCAYEDDGYCMDYENDCTCEHKKKIAEYSIEEKRIWKEFE